MLQGVGGGGDSMIIRTLDILLNFNVFGHFNSIKTNNFDFYVQINEIFMHHSEEYAHNSQWLVSELNDL